MRYRLLTCLGACLLLTGSCLAQSFASGSERVHVIELFTSEGCSSCPPADQWLRRFAASPDLWARLVPLAFHVDYWDYLGWQDPYAAAAHSARQRRYHKEGALRAVYTPGMVYDGQEWRLWAAGHLPELTAGGRPGVLSLNIEGSTAEADFVPLGPAVEKPRIHLALLGFDLQTKISAGENRGRTLRHDFVVLAISDAPMSPVAEGFVARLPMPQSATLAPRTAVAAWVSGGAAQTPLQAVGGWLPVQPTDRVDAISRNR